MKKNYFTNILFIVLALFCFHSTQLIAKNDGSNKSELKNRNSLVALPYAYYSPETKVAVGVGSIYSFRPAKSSLTQRPSSIKLALTYTQRKQTIVCFIPELYLATEKYLFNGFYCFYKYPDKFWGIGSNSLDTAEEDYTPNYLRTFTNIQKQVLPGFYVGLRYQFEYLKLIDTEESGILKDQKIPGSETGRASGIGFILNYDTRDNIYFPRSGEYFQIYNVYFEKYIASDYSFRLLNFDLRKFFSVKNTNHTVAFQTLNTFIQGEPPFQMLALMGGSYWMRGYFFGRYRDKNMITLQTEYRFPLFWRLGGVGFIGAGDVAGKYDKFSISNFKYSLGFGLRFMFDRQEKINARIDFGFGENGKSGMYVLVLEAF